MTLKAESGFQGPTDYQLKWFTWEFKSRPTVLGNPPVTHCIGIQNLQITKSCPPKQKQNTQGYYYTLRTQPTPTKITFSLVYVRGALNQQLHRLVDFWADKIGQDNAMFLGGQNAINKYIGDYVLSDLKVTNVKLLPSGDWASCQLDYTFEEVVNLPIGADLTGVSTALDIGA